MNVACRDAPVDQCHRSTSKENSLQLFINKTTGRDVTTPIRYLYWVAVVLVLLQPSITCLDRWLVVTGASLVACLLKQLSIMMQFHDKKNDYFYPKESDL
jgi:hypothetical protein